jgi:predicted RNase H-like nuclease (RuvC/YqgF family)
MEDQPSNLDTPTYTLEESTKALVDKMASGGKFPETLLQSVSLLEQIEQANSVISSMRNSVSQEDYTEAMNELSKYKEAYKRAKAARDNLAHCKADLENRITDLGKKVQKTDQLVSDLKQREAEVEALKRKVSTKVVSFESLYQDLKTLCESRTTLFSAPVGKTIEVCIKTDQQQPKLAYFLINRQSENQFTVINSQFR